MIMVREELAAFWWYRLLNFLLARLCDNCHSCKERSEFLQGTDLTKGSLSVSWVAS